MTADPLPAPASASTAPAFMLAGASAQAERDDWQRCSPLKPWGLHGAVVDYACTRCGCRLGR